MSAKLDSWTFEGVYYFYALVKCRKHSCNKCTLRPVHGPYLYKRERVGKGRGRTVERYVGKKESEAEQEELWRQVKRQAEADRVRDSITDCPF